MIELKYEVNNKGAKYVGIESFALDNLQNYFVNTAKKILNHAVL